ncbi:MAG: hypothetical protein A3G29_03435 [Burkholderiales bacterium RIFCSPLOWO2_12_FULL_64_99]|nr:MAG: hypothetical protein A3E52_11395 [Burkholderiales bacterium RIFCSPHIGHO2_12_FULL_63_20]OGB64534.1 MAG: hypothetical protein A3G29_03435 [Burkholderiales bacterium RIFCSPLOWO2_12_FULL_64_99]
MTDKTHLQNLLLNLLSPSASVTQDQLEALKEADWENMLVMVRQHRLAPLMHWQLSHAHPALKVPERIALALSTAFKNASFRSLTWQTALVRLHQLLDAAGIPYAALKGSYLAYHVYPHPALRPMRDVDIVTPKEHVLEAYRVLQRGGLTRLDEYPGEPEAAMLVHKHLPPLKMPGAPIQVELHARLLESPEGNSVSCDLSEEPGFWSRCVTGNIGTTPVRFEPTTDLLFHLIVHSVYEHQLNNGPLLLSDMAYLVNTHEIDWPLFWRLAADRQQTRGCVLALMLTQRYWPLRHVAWGDAQTMCDDLTDSTLDATAALILRNTQARSSVAMNSRLQLAGGWSNKARVLASKLMPSRTRIAATYPPTQRAWHLYAYYPAEWLRLFRVWREESKRVAPTDQHEEVRQMTSLSQWLN